MLANYFRSCYRDTMDRAYGRAEAASLDALKEGGHCLDCGATDGYWYDRLHSDIGLTPNRYAGIDWNSEACARGQARRLNLNQGALNERLPFGDGEFRCIIALSVLEPGGVLMQLTPNIVTYFTALRILMGKLPSSGPHPDSSLPLSHEGPPLVRDEALVLDV